MPLCKKKKKKKKTLTHGQYMISLEHDFAGELKKIHILGVLSFFFQHEEVTSLI